MIKLYFKKINLVFEFFKVMLSHFNLTIFSFINFNNQTNKFTAIEVQRDGGSDTGGVRGRGGPPRALVPHLAVERGCRQQEEGLPSEGQAVSRYKERLVAFFYKN